MNIIAADAAAHGIGELLIRDDNKNIRTLARLIRRSGE
jgi:hypothetical protein